MISINNGTVKLIKTNGLVRSYNTNDCDVSIYVYLLTDGKCTGSVCAKQFICKTKDEINYNIFIINTRSSEVASVKLLDILPKGANVSDIKSVTLEGKDPIKYTIKDNSIEFSIDSIIKTHLYSRIVVTIQNNIGIDIESNNVQILEVT